MYAIVDIAGQQFKVEKGQEIFVHRLEGDEGSKVDFNNVLLIDQSGKVNVGTPLITGAFVKAKILEHLKGDKVLVFKKKRRKGYKKLNGHRQYLSLIKIEDILEKGGKPKAEAKPKAGAKPAAKPAAKIAEPKPKVEAKPKAEVEAAAKAAAKKAEPKPKAETKPKAEAKPAAKPAAKKAKPKPKAEAKPKAAAKKEAKPAAKPAAKKATPKAKAEDKPAAKPKADKKDEKSE
mgnify:FL=1